MPVYISASAKALGIADTNKVQPLSAFQLPKDSSSRAALGDTYLSIYGGSPALGTSNFEVRLPAWDDIIHLVPTALQSTDQITATRARMFSALAKSPTPEVVNDTAKIAQQVDNIQDALVGLSVAGRLATSILGRSIPGVSWIANAADIVNVLNIFYPNTLATQALSTGKAAISAARQGRSLEYLAEYTKAVAAGEAKPGLAAYGRAMERKRQASLASVLQTGTYAQRLETTLETGKVGFGFGEALQILQTTDQLYGFGLSLGPIFGAAQDSVFGALRGATFDITGPLSFAEQALAPIAFPFVAPFKDYATLNDYFFDLQHQAPIKVYWPGVIPLVDASLGLQPGTTERWIEDTTAPLVDPIQRAEKKALQALGAVNKAMVGAAKAVFNAGWAIWRSRDELAWSHHMEILVAQCLALQHMTPYFQNLPWGELTRAALVAENKTLQVAPGLKFDTWSDTDVPLMLREAGGFEPLSFLAQAPTPEAREWGHSLVAMHADLLLHCLEGPSPDLRTQSDPLFRALVCMDEYGLGPPLTYLPDDFRDYVQTITDEIKIRDGEFPPRPVVQRIFLHAFPGSKL